MFSREPDVHEGRGKYACNFGLSTRRLRKFGGSQRHCRARGRIDSSWRLASAQRDMPRQQRSEHKYSTWMDLLSEDATPILTNGISHGRTRDVGSQVDSIHRARGRDPRNHRPGRRSRAAAAYCRTGEARQDDRAQSSEDAGRAWLRASSRRRYALSSRRPHSQSGADRRRRRRAS
jgi:hypothetical protein